jgi:hypothetical protein
MVAVVQVFRVNSFDFENMRRGVAAIFGGVNPWAPETRILHYYNPPYAVLFLWPMLFTTPQFMLVIGAALLFALVFYEKSWAALAWFATNTMLWLIAAGGVDMYLIGAGVLCLLAGDRRYESRWGLVLRVIAYGFLLVKPQGGFFIVALFVLLRRDWKGVLGALLVYVLPFMMLYPDWAGVLLSDPPLAQTEAAHTILKKFGFQIAIAVAILVIFARNWRYWHLGGALAGILMPYGMPGLPIFLTLCAVRRASTIPAFVLFSALLASLTWVTPSASGRAFYDILNPLMSIYHLSMLGLALILACYLGWDESGRKDAIFTNTWLRKTWQSRRRRREASLAGGEEAQ